MEPPHKTETKSSLPGGLLSSDVEVPLSNLIKEDVMAMIDPEDPQPLLDNEIKNNNLNTTTRLLNSPPKFFETIIAGLCLLFGFARFYIPYYHYALLSEKAQTYLYSDNAYTKITALATILMIAWELFVLMNIWCHQSIHFGKFIVVQEFFQLIFLSMAIYLMFNLNTSADKTLMRIYAVFVVYLFCGLIQFAYFFSKLDTIIVYH